MIFPENDQDIIDLSGLIFDKYYMIISNGTNILFNDIFFDGIIINMSNYDKMEFRGKYLYAQSGVKNNAIISLCRTNNISNLCFLAGIPGRIGGAAFMNAGAFGSSMADCLKEIRIYDLNERKFLNIDKKEFDYFYRGQNFIKQGYIILSCLFDLKYADNHKVNSKINEYIIYRKEKHPSKPSAGSVFKNPSGYSAGKLIDDLGMKGKLSGGAQISPLHGNFIVNINNAGFNDIISLIVKIKERVYQKHKIALETEIKIIKSISNFQRLTAS